MPPLPSVPTVDGPAIIVDSDGVVDEVNGDKAARNGSVPGLLNDSISSACTDELHVSAEQTPTGTNTESGSGPAVDMEVMGIYKRGSVPRESELPKDYVLKDCQQDQVMVRQRLKTRPLLDDAEEEHDLIEEEEAADDSDSSDSSSDSSDGSDADDESATKTANKKQQKQKKKKMSKQSKKERTTKSLRRRLKSKAADGTEYDVAMFKPEQGLVMRKRDWPFYHADLSEHSDSSDDERVSA